MIIMKFNLIENFEDINLRVLLNIEILFFQFIVET
jgi:hypothetical protein